MAVINYNEFGDYLKKSDKDGFASVYLIFGEELLYKTVFEELLDELIPGPARGLNYEPVDGADEKINQALQRINTYSLLPGTKVVAICDTQIFYSKLNEKALIEKAKKEYNNDNIKKAANYLLSLLGLLNLSFDDISKANRGKALKFDIDRSAGEEWFDKTIDYCLSCGLSPSNGQDKAKLLQQVIENGFPKDNHLIITADMVDKRKSLYKAINKYGMVVDCSVPKGERRADRMAQERILYENMETVLTKNKKRMDKAAIAAMFEMTGFNLRSFLNNLEKLISYVGEQNRITIDDVKFVLKRTKKDPIFELTNAISERNLEKALFFLNSLLPQLDHPLQLFAAITNQVRKLLLIKGFVESPHGGAWHSGIRFDQFQRSVMPAIKTYDKELLSLLEDWKSKPATDLLVAQNPNNPYPVYQMLLRSERFTTDELVEDLKLLSEVDLRLKSTGGNPKIILEKVIFHICGGLNTLPRSSRGM
ncbi:MAG: DNA polymerase III subunit delta [Thermodesulfobacteriota bacterium]|nr:DNA polymerase III subunit delta [Thermodesulfobacteriota bacterium]